MPPTIILTSVRSARGKTNARILIDSIRTFGGALRDCSIWLFETNSHQAA